MVIRLNNSPAIGWGVSLTSKVPVARVVTVTSFACGQRARQSAMTSGVPIYCGCLTVRKYGLWVVNPSGYFALAASSDTEVGMMTS